MAVNAEMKKNRRRSVLGAAAALYLSPMAALAAFIATVLTLGAVLLAIQVALLILRPAA